MDACSAHAGDAAHAMRCEVHEAPQPGTTRWAPRMHACVRACSTHRSPPHDLRCAYLPVLRDCLLTIRAGHARQAAQARVVGAAHNDRRGYLSADALLRSRCLFLHAWCTHAMSSCALRPLALQGKCSGHSQQYVRNGQLGSWQQRSSCQTCTAEEETCTHMKSWLACSWAHSGAFPAQ